MYDLLVWFVSFHVILCRDAVRCVVRCCVSCSDVNVCLCRVCYLLDVVISSMLYCDLVVCIAMMYVTVIYQALRQNDVYYVV